MSSKKDQEKLQAERHQLIIQELLRDEDNKYCVDCDAKGPRWASWNIGVFLCIRCAGIHRNLGVHISKVKSVNLDTWTLAQLAMMREMGNSRARAIYEAKLPDNFRRPQSDAALENFIRSKYEHKRYIASEYVPVKPDVDALLKEIQRLEQTSKKRHTANAVALPHGQSQQAVDKRLPQKAANTPDASIPNDKPVDLLGLGSLDSGSTPSSGDGFTPFTSGISLNTSGDRSAKSDNVPVTPANPSTVSAGQPVPETGASSGGGGSAALDLFGLNFGGPSSDSGVSAFASSNTAAQSSTSVASTTANPKCSKESILALYQQCTPPTGMFQTPAAAAAAAPTPAAYGQYAGPTPPSNWAFGGALNASDQWANSRRAPGFNEQQQSHTMSAFQLPTNFGPSTTGITPFSLQNETNSQGAINFQLPGSTTAPNVPSWSEPNKNWSAPASQPPANLFGSLGTPAATGDRNQAPVWSMANQTANPGLAAFDSPKFFTPTTVNTTAAAHQAYLSQVQSQLASLQLGATVNQQQ